VEFRVRTDADPSGATSGVVLMWPQSNRWPIDGETDIYETGTDTDRTPFSSFVHFGADNQQVWVGQDADGTQWHAMAMEWTPTAIRFYRDGALVGEVTDPRAIPHVPQHLTVQLDAFSSTMTGTVRMQVDDVRILAYTGRAAHREDPRVVGEFLSGQRPVRSL
jgi:beta-glucanase (GH16 family)